MRVYGTILHPDQESTDCPCCKLCKASFGTWTSKARTLRSRICANSTQAYTVGSNNFVRVKQHTLAV